MKSKLFCNILISALKTYKFNTFKLIFLVFFILTNTQYIQGYLFEASFLSRSPWYRLMLHKAMLNLLAIGL